MFALLSDYTIQNVLIGAALLGIVSGVLGSFAVLRRQSLLGDTLYVVGGCGAGEGRGTSRATGDALRGA